MSLLAAWQLLTRYGWIIAAALAVWWIADMRSDLATTREKVVSLSRDVKAEKKARERDVAALTTLAQGLTKAATDTAADAKALSEVIDHANPAPASDGLAALLRRLRAEDRDRASSAAGGTGAAASRGAAGAR